MVTLGTVTLSDHLTLSGIETGQVDAVLDGEIGEFITAQLLGVKNPNRSAGPD